MIMNLTVNGVTVPDDVIAREAQRHIDAPDPDAAARRALAARILLRQRARELGFIDDDSAEPGDEIAIIARVLDAEVGTPTPDEDACRRYYDTHPQQFVFGELIEARHILFAVTPGTPIARLRARAEAVVTELLGEPSRFAQRAAELSNCPSGMHGGNLGQFGRGEMVPEFDRALFGHDATGVLPRLIQTRHGFHVVLVERRIPGRVLDFAEVREDIAACLASRVQARALAQYLKLLAGRARIEGADLDAATNPLVQ